LANHLKSFWNNGLSPPPGANTTSARVLRSRGRRRGILSSDWVKKPNALSRSPLLEDSPMAWTKPEAEVVAVTMEVTAYVATL
jgi:hypothetical protein